MNARSFRRLARFAPLLLLVLASCAKNAPQDYFNHANGAEARQVDHLFKPVFWIAAAVFFFVQGLVVFIAFKFRDRPGREEPKQVHGNTKLEFTWTVIPALLLAVISVPTVLTIFDTAAKHQKNEVYVQVVGKQWWWEYHYKNTTPEVVTANELVIPVGRSVFLDLNSTDVIHSFWVPRLAGKQDVVPGRTNTMRIIADEPGEYYGQCAEFCSLSHANMRLRVIAKSAADYDAWLKHEQTPAVEPVDAAAMQGKELFLQNACIQCHAIGGTPASGTIGPNLTHIGARGTFGGATFDLNEKNLFDWIKHARELKPGVIMPDFDRPLQSRENVAGFRQLTDDQIRAIVAYLLGLK
jgi:cytochrome c oxidase subunit 2